MEKEDREILKALLSSLPLIILAIIFPVLAAHAFLKPDTELLPQWFQRSGSITVMFSVWCEYNLAKVNGYIYPSGLVALDDAQLSEKYKKIYKIARYFGVLLAISGTIIWGYGDQLIKVT